ncbi:MAG: hypothetical protein ACYDBV_00240 [Nitrospiria bacterium]
MGDSHPAYGVDPEYLSDDFYNFSYPSENLIMTYLKLKYAVGEKKEIKYIVLPLDFHIFSDYRRNGSDYSRYFLLSSINKIYQIVGIRDILKSVLKYYLPLSSYYNRQQFIEYLFRKLKIVLSHHSDNKVSKNISISEYGHITSPGNYNNLSDQEKSQEVSSRIKEQMKRPLDDRLLSFYFEKILIYCKDNGIKVIGIRYPVSKEYYSSLPMSELVQVSKEMEKQTPYFFFIKDYSHLYFQNPDYFANSDHLNNNGSLNFAKVLRSDFLSHGVLSVE